MMVDILKLVYETCRLYGLARASYGQLRVVWNLTSNLLGLEDFPDAGPDL